MGVSIFSGGYSETGILYQYALFQLRMNKTEIITFTVLPVCSFVIIKFSIFSYFSILLEKPT